MNSDAAAHGSRAATLRPAGGAAATTGSAYQRALIAQFAASVPVTEVPCPGLADAINAGDEAATAAAVATAAAIDDALPQMSTVRALKERVGRYVGSARQRDLLADLGERMSTRALVSGISM